MDSGALVRIENMRRDERGIGLGQRDARAARALFFSITWYGKTSYDREKLPKN